jgi:predicted enzyme related to lactoylglutathione lyase
VESLLVFGYDEYIAHEEASMPRVVHFEIAVDNPERAFQFYTNVFGYYAVCKNSEGNTFGIMQDDPTAK